MYSEDAGGQKWNPNHANEDFDVPLFVKKTSCGASQSVSNFKPSVHSWTPRPRGQLIQQQTRGAASMTPRRPTKIKSASTQNNSLSGVLVVTRVAESTPVNDTVRLFEVSYASSLNVPE